nr:Concanavalin A-like lectin/glucanases superfamily [uncultured organism]
MSALSRRWWAFALVGALLGIILTVGLPSVTLAAFTAQTGTGASFGTGAFPTYAESVQAAGPLGYYKLDDAAGTTGPLTDSSGRSNPAVQVHTAQTFRLPGSPAGGTDTGTSLNLPGSSYQGYLTSRDSLDLSSNRATTFEVWFRTTGSNQVLMDLVDVARGTPTTTDRVLSITSAGTLRFASSVASLTSSDTVNNGSWHMAAAVLGGGTQSLYLDGQLVGNTGYAGTPTMTSGYVRVGGDSTWFAGGIDAVTVFNSLESGARVNARYSATPTGAAAYTSAVNTSAPWALWNLDDNPTGPWNQADIDYPTTLTDSSGAGHPAIARNLPPALGALGQAGAVTGPGPQNAMRMDGSGWAYASQFGTVMNTFTYELWLKTTTTSGGVLALVTTRAGDTCHNPDSTYRCGRMLFMDATGKLKFGIQPSTTFQSVTSTRALNDGQWHYIVAASVVPPSGTTSTLDLYVDGVLDGSATVSTPAGFTGYFAFGGGGLPWLNSGAWPPNASFTGLLDEIAYYDKTLSPTVIARHWGARGR